MKQPMHKSFANAGRGMVTLIKKERNVKIHILISTAVIIAGLYFGIQPWEWAMLVITIGLVLTAEAFNTVIEETLDLVTPEYNEKTKRAKDISAAAVVFSVIAAVCVGIIIFLPRILALLT